MEITKIRHNETIKEYVEEKLKNTVRDLTPYKKHLVGNSKILRFLSQHTISSIDNMGCLGIILLGIIYAFR